MFGALATILLILSLAFGGGGISVAAAQTSLPDEPLYGLKLWSEEARLRLNGVPQAQFELALKLIERRSNEIMTMLADGKTPTDKVLERYQAQVEMALHLAVGLPEGEALPAMVRLQDRLRLMEQTTQTMMGTPQAEVVQTRIRTMLQECINWIDGAEETPDQYQQMLKDRDQDRDQDGKQDKDQNRIQLHTGTPASTGGKQNSSNDGNCGEECTPAATGKGGNPWTETTPTPGSEYGPGPQATDAPGPGPQATDAPGPGPQATDAPGLGPQATDNPGPGPAEQPTQSGPKNSKP